MRSSQSATRVTDNSYESGDKIGLYVVNYNGSTAGTPATSGNHVDNMSFTYNGSWTPASPIYWLDDATHADFYAYYPYATVSNIAAHTFTAKADQSTEADYKASEFLWGKTADVAPTASAVGITTKHCMSCAVVKVAPGNGFTAETLAAATVSVRLNGIKTAATADLTTSTLTATGEAAAVTPLTTDGTYKALIVPQSVQADNFITVTVDGRDYNLAKEFTFVAGKRHTFTVTVSKTGSGINVDISGWEDDDVDNGGTAE